MQSEKKTQQYILVFFTFQGEEVWLWSVESGVYGGFIYATTLASRPISLPPGRYSPPHPLQNRVSPFQRRSVCDVDDKDLVTNLESSPDSPVASTYVIMLTDLPAFHNN